MRLAALVIGCAGCKSFQANAREKQMIEEPVSVLHTSDDSDELLTAALSLARSEHPDDHQALLKSLKSSKILGKLDSAEDYLQMRDWLRVAKVIQRLSENKAPSALSVLTAWMKDPVFLAEPSRVELLIEASAVIRPATPEVVDFWNRHADPNGIYINLIMPAVVTNGTRPALEVFEQKMADPSYEDELKIDCMRRDVLRHRDLAPLLKSCESLLTKGLPERLRPELVEVLFDYKAEWYKPANTVNPPDGSKMTVTGRATLRHIGEFALKNLTLTQGQRRAVEDTLARLQQSGPG